MDLKSGYPFWAISNGLMHAFPKCEDDLLCDVAVIGGGITGALVADEFARNGHAVAVVEQRDCGWGSTAASTAMLQYEIDTHLVDLAKRHGEDAAVLAYRACSDAVEGFGAIARRVGDCGFSRADSLYWASRRGHVDALQDEYLARRRHGFAVEWLEAGDVRARFGFDAPAAVLSRVGARVDPYRFALRLLEKLRKAGVAVHDRSPVDRIVAGDRGVTLELATGASVRAKYLVVAAGYAGQRFLPKPVARNRSSYAYVSDPVGEDALAQLRGLLAWESARPYLYLRTTADHRVLVGGEDDAVDIPSRRDARVQKKARTLHRKFGKLFPHVDATPAFAWAGTFAETADGLPFFGPHPALSPRVHFALAYGGNGITYSLIGAGLLRAHVERRRHPLAALFGFARVA